MRKLGIIFFLMVIAVSVYAASVGRVNMSVFKAPQARVLNAVFSDISDAIDAITSVVDTNATTDATIYTPVSVGQVLFGHSGTGTNSAWYASGLTTNDWVKYAQFVP